MPPQVITDNEDNADVVPRNLHSLLQKGKEIRIIGYNSSPLVSKGENFASTVLKVDALVSKDNASPIKKLHLVAKMIPMSDFQQTMVNPTISFTKEIYVHGTLLKMFRQIERESKVLPEWRINVAPKFYGGRLSLNAKQSNDADEDAVLLLENLQTKGYYVGSKKTGLDLDHSLRATTKLAQFHALGIALKQKKPKLFRRVKKQVDVSPLNIDKCFYNKLVEKTLKLACEDSRIGQYVDRIASCILRQQYDHHFDYVPVGNWVTIIHGDFWINNILFHQDNGYVDDVKFIDYQLTRFHTATKDLPLFLCCCTNDDVLTNHFDKLVDAYYESFIHTLVRTGCDVSSFSRDSFNRQLKQDAHDELFRCLLMMKIFMQDVSEDTDLNDMESNVMLTNGNNPYRERSLKVILKFVEKNWI